MSLTVPKIYNWVLTFSILAFTWALVWFAFVYYPKVVNQYKTGQFPKKLATGQVYASSYKFPIETSAFRLVYEVRSGTYYAFIAGQNLDQYLINRDSTQLALKTALSVQSLCGVNVIYSSVENLKIPDRFKVVDSGCK
jgi:TRAP-type C4-dicarboxylate transport system permease small subunit